MSETCGGLASNTKPFAEMVKYTKEEAIRSKPSHFMKKFSRSSFL